MWLRQIGSHRSDAERDPWRHLQCTVALPCAPMCFWSRCPASQARRSVLALLGLVRHHAERSVGVLDQQRDPSEQDDEEDEGRSFR